MANEIEHRLALEWLLSLLALDHTRFWQVAMERNVHPQSEC